MENSKKSFPEIALAKDVLLAPETLYRLLVADAASPDPLAIPGEDKFAFVTWPVLYGLAEMFVPVIVLLKMD